MRLAYFLSGLAAGIFTLFRIPRMPAAFKALSSSGDYERAVAVGFVCLTVLTALVTYVCVRKSFPPPRKE